MVAGNYLPREINCLADDGRLAIIALLGGAHSDVDLSQILRRRLTITGSTLRPRSIEFKTAIVAKLQSQVWPFLQSKRIKPVIYRIFPLEQAAQAHELMETSRHIGKIMLKI
jgi:NADPH2:quinone reductase